MSENTSLALYIHWPFCKAKCPYCDFNSHVRENVAQDDWRKALVAELRWYSAQLGAEIENNSTLAQGSAAQAVGFGGVTPPFKKKISSIFFGGGTPSLMPPATVEALIAEAEKIFGFTPNIEITLEANPTSVEAERFKAYRAAGVNRLSLGIQSLTSQHLAFLGREHSVAEARAAIDLASTIFQRFSFDLIYALYGQSLNDWEKELQAALAISRNHLSLYQLTIEEGTKFYHLHQAGKLPTLSADEGAAYYELTQSIMEAAGMPAYEISNHATAGQESAHNLTYWRGGEYIGIGPGAHGRLMLKESTEQSDLSSEALAKEEAQGGRGSEAWGGKPPTKRFSTLNLRSPEKWLAQVQDVGHGQESATRLSTQDVKEEKLLMGIRLREGIERAAYAWPEAKLTALETEGLITLSPTHLIPTAKGRLVLNSLIEHLATSA